MEGQEIIQGRRLMYYWTILNKSDKELVKKVFSIQKQFPTSDDWIVDVEENLQYCQINLSEKQIKNMKKQAFKKIVKKHITLKAEEYLSALRESHSKTEKISL